MKTINLFFFWNLISHSVRSLILSKRIYCLILLLDGGVKAIAPNGKVAPQLWRVVPRSESESVTVDISDTIKLGKKTFKILQVLYIFGSIYLSYQSEKNSE